MKQFIKVFVLFFVVAVVGFLPPGNSLVGRWITYAPNGMQAYIDFKPDGTFKVIGPDGEIGHSGNYKLDNATFSIKNDKGGCGDGYWGTYQLTFYGRDSVSFAVIRDSCTGRREEIVGGNPGLRRIKKK